MVAGNATHAVEHRKIDEVMPLGSWLLAHSYGAELNGRNAVAMLFLVRRMCRGFKGSC
jgi:hypothetical protein